MHFVNKCIRENKLLLRFDETARQIALNVVGKMCRCSGVTETETGTAAVALKADARTAYPIYSSFVCALWLFDLLNKVRCQVLFGHSLLNESLGRLATECETLFQCYIFIFRIHETFIRLSFHFGTFSFVGVYLKCPAGEGSRFCF